MQYRKQLNGHRVNAKYWFTIIEMEALYFMFIKSVRIGDFDIFWNV